MMKNIGKYCYVLQGLSDDYIKKHVLHASSCSWDSTEDRIKHRSHKISAMHAEADSLDAVVNYDKGSDYFKSEKQIMNDSYLECNELKKSTLKFMHMHSLKQNSRLLCGEELSFD